MALGSSFSISYCDFMLELTIHLAQACRLKKREREETLLGRHQGCLPVAAFLGYKHRFRCRASRRLPCDALIGRSEY
jgi:hypothetical protein